MRTTLCWLLIILFAVPASAARRSPRETAAHTSNGASVTLVLVTGEKLKGRLMGVTQESVTVASNDSSAGVQPREVKFSEIKSFKRRPAIVKNILAGFGVASVLLMAFSGLINS